MQALRNIPEENILFLDIETVPQYAHFSLLPYNEKLLWLKKAGFLIKSNQTPSEMYERAGIYAEFGKIVCISAGVIHHKNNEKLLRIKSFSSDNEWQLLNEFTDTLNKSFNTQHHYLCAHNGKEFDFPYLARRMLINKIPLPMILDSAGRKPWEVRHLDTLELWKFGDYKSYTSLELLTDVFGVPTPKDDIKGSDVAKVYWKEKNLKRIVKYCQKDVEAIVQLFMQYKQKSAIQKIEIA